MALGSERVNKKEVLITENLWDLKKITRAQIGHALKNRYPYNR